MPTVRPHSKAKQQTRGQRKASMARKRDERASRSAARRQKRASSCPTDDETLASFSAQLQKMGLQLRDIPGDGNCLFRALADQLEGHSDNHYVLRQKIVDYMTANRDDFEPFVEDDMTFDRHISNLRQFGCYAGNDAIVAFARLLNITVIIHQVNSPLLKMHGCGASELQKQVHISYHNGDHYGSVRRIGDNSDSPANIQLQEGHVVGHNPGHTTTGSQASQPFYTDNGQHSDSDDDSSGYSENEDSMSVSTTGTSECTARVFRGHSTVEEDVMNNTGCRNLQLVRSILADSDYDVDLATFQILQIMATANYNNDRQGDWSSSASHDVSLWSENGTGTRVIGSLGVATPHPTRCSQGVGTKPKLQLSTKEKKAAKKKRAADRHRQRLTSHHVTMGSNGVNCDPETTMVTHTLGVLQI